MHWKPPSGASHPSGLSDSWKRRPKTAKKIQKGDDGDGDVLGGVIALGSPSRFGAPITTNHKVWLMLPEWECLAVVEIILTMPVLLCWSKRAG